ncbi:unnamed protein product [Paramecium octaurelia]|uniref:Uncharacterized protein n=1 Tax=Paramecium octaurelia TaxID=43137 RepID=A0A8S1S8Y8_PAROT|nr:unnamed protein product [Paramecium octaurelia]
MDLDEEEQPILHFNYNYDEAAEIDSSLKTRLKFIKKVYLIINIQIFISGALSLLQISYRDQQEIKEVEYLIFAIVALFAFSSMCFLLCKQRFARRAPNNYILLIFNMLTSGFVISEIIFFVTVSNDKISNDLITKAIQMTFLIFTALTILAWTSQDNFSIKKNILLSFSLCLTLLLLFYYQFETKERVIFFIILAIFLYSVYIINGIKQIFDKKRHSLQKDDYILGALFMNFEFMYIYEDLSEYFQDIFWKKK